MLADRLKKSVSEIMELTALEIDMWIAYLKIEADATNKQMRQAKARTRSRR
jgi:hypothetical protein|tara:strand:+ start:186 stop:338 length:153 start_codon:yes stop_codon:yes gene_type:complete